MFQNIIFDTDSTISKYCGVFDGIEKEFEHGQFDDTNILVTQIDDKVEALRELLWSEISVHMLS